MKFEFRMNDEQTRKALEEYSQKWGYEEWLAARSWVESQWFAWLVALLKAEPDTHDLFPKGKWATIQEMEGVLQESARAELSTRKVFNTFS
jgi:hypothetical protein